MRGDERPFAVIRTGISEKSRLSRIVGMSGPVAQPKNIRKLRVCFLVYLVGHEKALGDEELTFPQSWAGWLEFG